MAKFYETFRASSCWPIEVGSSSGHNSSDHDMTEALRTMGNQISAEHREADMTVEHRTLSGSCLCGRMTYEVADTFEYAMNCHCSQCRRATGSAFKPLAGTKASRLTLTSGNAQLLRYEIGRASCRERV